MSLRATRQSGTALAARLVVLAATVAVAGCSLSPFKSTSDREAGEVAELFADIEQPAEQSSPASGEPVASPAEVDQAEAKSSLDTILKPPPAFVVAPPASSSASVALGDWQTIEGGVNGNFMTGVASVDFRRPVAVAARDAFIYVVDADLQAVLRYDRMTRRVSSVLDLRGVARGEVSDIYVAPDLSFYIADPLGGRVKLFSHNGRLLQTFENRLNMAKPVAVAVLDNQDVIVADGHYDHLLRFTPSGELIAAYSGRGLDAGDFLNILNMAVGPDGYYVGARVGRKVQVISPEGEYLYSFEEDAVRFPSAMVVDSENRSYIADLMDDQIKIYDRGRLVSTIGGHGGTPGRFKRIADLWLDDESLYVADSLNGRIQFARILSDGTGRLDTPE